MRWLGLLVISSISMSAGHALAVPQPDAESAYAQGDYATAYRLLLPLAEQGSARAQEQIAEMYEKGIGVPQDEAKAREWYRRAAEQSAKDAERAMEASQGIAGTTQPAAAPVILGGSSNSPAVVPLTPMPRTAPIVYPAAWPPPAPYRPAPFFVPVPSHHHWHHH